MRNALSISNLHKTYESGTTAIAGINLDVAKGSFFGLLGPNGAGKTTTIGIITSLVTKTSGKVEIFGIDIDRDFPAAKRLLGVVPQEFNFSVFEKVEDIVIQQAGYYGIPRSKALENTKKYLTELGLWDKRKSSARELSGGMKRRLMIARGLVHEPQLLILDEPTAGVDVELRRGMWEFLKKLNATGKTIILTTHYLEEAEMLCDRIAIIAEGNIIENKDKKTLLQKLDKESFIFECEAPLAFLPSLPGVLLKAIDDTSFEVQVPKGTTLNSVYRHLSEHDIKVLSMRNKSNRLEELFLLMVEK